MIDYNNIDWGKGAQTFTDSYGKQTEQSTGGQKVDLKQYLSLQLPDGVDEGEIVIRLLPNQDNPLEFYTAKKFHNIMVAKKWTKLYDPGQDGEESPLYDKYRLLKNGDKAEQESAKSYLSKDFYIVRCIQRGKEEEGIKFWRFAHNYKKTGVMDKLKPLIARLNERNYGTGAIWNPIAGRDIIISLVKDKTKGKAQTNVVSIQLDDMTTKLSENTELMNLWLNDTRIWSDVYSKKGVEYLRIVADGHEPMWDKELKKFVPKAGDDHVEPAYAAPAAKPSFDVDNSEVEPEELINIDDLPF